MLNALEVAAGRPPAGEAVRVYAFAILLMLRSPNVATPFTAFCVVVPARVPGPVPIANVIAPLKDARGTLVLSSAVTTTAGVMVSPAPLLVGCAVNTSW